MTSAARSSRLRTRTTSSTAAWTPYDARFGCLTAIDVLDKKANDPADASHEYDTGDTTTLTSVLTAVISYRSEKVADAAMDDFDRGLTRCKPVDETDDDGTRWKIDPQTDTKVQVDGGDRQTTVSGVGTFSGGPADVDGSLALHGTAVRVDNNVVVVVMGDLTDDLGTARDDVTQAADRPARRGRRQRGPACPGRGARGLRPRWRRRRSLRQPAQDRPAGIAPCRPVSPVVRVPLSAPPRPQPPRRRGRSPCRSSWCRAAPGS